MDVVKMIAIWWGFSLSEGMQEKLLMQGLASSNFSPTINCWLSSPLPFFLCQFSALLPLVSAQLSLPLFMQAPNSWGQA